MKVFNIVEICLEFGVDVKNSSEIVSGENLSCEKSFFFGLFDINVVGIIILKEGRNVVYWLVLVQVNILSSFVYNLLCYMSTGSCRINVEGMAIVLV